MPDYADKTYESKDGLTLYYRDYKGPKNARHTVLCLPGLTRNSRDFAQLAECLSAKYRVLCADLRGRGRSEYAKDPMTYQLPHYVKDVHELLNTAGVKEAVFIGTSLGGLVTMLAANVIRSRVKAAVLNDVGPEIDQVGLTRIGNYVGKRISLGSWIEAAEMCKSLNSAVYPSWSDAEWMAMAKNLWKENADGTIAVNYDTGIAVPFKQESTPAEVGLWPLFEGMKGIPTLVIRGELSDLLTPETFDQMENVYPGLLRVTVPNVGHAPTLDERESRKAIEDFLAGLPQASFLGRIRKRFAAAYYLLRTLKIYSQYTPA